VVAPIVVEIKKYMFKLSRIGLESSKSNPLHMHIKSGAIGVNLPGFFVELLHPDKPEEKTYCKIRTLDDSKPIQIVSQPELDVVVPSIVVSVAHEGRESIIKVLNTKLMVEVNHEEERHDVSDAMQEVMLQD